MEKKVGYSIVFPCSFITRPLRLPDFYKTSPIIYAVDSLNSILLLLKSNVYSLVVVLAFAIGFNRLSSLSLSSIQFYMTMLWMSRLFFTNFRSHYIITRLDC